MKIVIIGASAAGVSAAKTVKTLEPTTEVVMISKEASIHSRCMLHKYLSHERDAQGINFVSKNFCDVHKIQWLKETTVSSVNSQKKQVKTFDGKEISYDQLIITSGASYFIPPVPGMREAKNVYGFRDLCDAEALDAAAKKGKTAIVVGAGLVGLDAATALLERGLKVTIVEMMDRVMGLQLDQKAGLEYQKLFEKAGAKFLLNEKVVAVNLDENSLAKSVSLASGKIIPADFMVVAAGVRPSYDFLEGSDVKTDRGITVGDDMKTSHSDIYAAGDVTGLSGIWPNAMKQGEIAAKNCLGKKVLYEDRYALKNTANFYGLTSLSLGNINPEAKEACEIYTREDKNTYEKIVVKNGVVLGIILQGDISNAGFWQYLIKNKYDVSKIKKPIFNLSYADFYAINPKNGEYHYSA